MTVQELIDKLNELPENLRNIPVRIATENEDGDLTEVIANIPSIGGSKIWWMADHVTLSARY
jgi:hypothetical protein